MQLGVNYMATNVIKENKNKHVKFTKEQKKESFKYFKNAFKKSYKYLLLDFIFMVLDVVCELSIPFVSKNLVSGVGRLVENNTWEVMQDVCINVGIMSALAVLGLVFGIMCMYLSTKFANLFTYSIRNDLFGKIQQFSFKNLDHFDVSSLVTRITSDCNNIRLCLTMIGRMGLKTPLMVIVSAVYMFIMDFKLAFIIIGIALVISLILSFIISKSVPLFSITQKKLDNLNLEVEEQCNGIKEIKAFVKEDYMLGKFDKANESLKQISVKVYSLINVNYPVVLFGLNIVNALILYYFGMQAQAFDYDSLSGLISSFTSYGITILMAFNFFSVLLLQLVRATASKHRLDEVFVEEIDIPYIEKTKTGDFDPNLILSGDIEFKNCGLSYHNDPDKLAVGPLNLRINQGEIVGIVGGTGSGKTSLINLIPRLYDTTIGEVKVGGVNVKDYSVQALRDAIGVVSQKNLLFSGTIKENILWGKKDASDEELKQALDLSCSSEFVNTFLDKENSYVSQGGKSVSGGQKQRLSIARALIKKPKILILDDATSAVDTITESKIKKAFYNELKDTTVLLIAQRISSVKDADKIIVLDNGNMVGLGKHEELLKSCKVYKEIYDLQNSGVTE